jgi:hypothetical protein
MKEDLIKDEARLLERGAFDFFSGSALTVKLPLFPNFLNVFKDYRERKRERN